MLYILGVLAEGDMPEDPCHEDKMENDSIDEVSSKKENKTFLVLLLFRQLESGKKITKTDFVQDYHISSRSFDRYIAEIRCYLLEQEPYLELRFDKGTEAYALTKPIL